MLNQPDAALALLDPVLVHHIVNTLQWPTLRPLQAAAVEPLVTGSDALLLAPTAGGKTEAAIFPLLSRAAAEGWTGTSILYVCPLKALLNNLQPRLHTYAQWLGRSAAIWHGDTNPTERRRLVADPPDILLTTPESIEAILVSTKVDERRLFGRVRAVVVDEIHAFAGDDRGWHLLSVLDRVTHLGGGGDTVSRVGLSATVGNPTALLAWLQGSAASGHAGLPPPDGRPGVVLSEAISEAVGTRARVDIAVDHVGSLENAAAVIAALHRGEKRLVFVESRRRAEQLGAELRSRGLETFISHSSLSAAERRRAEEAFAVGRDCVIVATSTLELGIDVGDLDRVIQIDAPAKVASFLQRLGRTGRRPGSTRNCLFLCLDGQALLQVLGLLVLWRRGWVEPVTPSPSPRHLAVQQILALALQHRVLGLKTLVDDWKNSPVSPWFAEVLPHMLSEGYLERDGDLGFIGPEAERNFGRRHFSGLTASFVGPPDFTVLEGRTEIGTLPLSALTAAADGPRIVLLAGRSWEVGFIDWKRRRCFVTQATRGGRAARWSGLPLDLSFPVVRAMRDVILGDEPEDVCLTQRAVNELAEVREHWIGTVRRDGTVIARGSRDLTWWSWAGGAANRTLLASLSGVADPHQRTQPFGLRLRPDLSHLELGHLLDNAAKEELTEPAVDDEAVRGLKFSEALAPGLAAETLAERLGDPPGALTTLREPRSFVHDSVRE